MALESDSIHPAASSKSEAARILYEIRDEVLSKWVARVKLEVLTANTLPTPVIINTIPIFLNNLALALCEDCIQETASESSNVSQEHGGERARVTKFGPDQILQEYKILREVVHESLRSHMSLSGKDLNTLQKSFDKAIQEGMTAYFLVHNRIRESLLVSLTHDLRDPIGTIKLAAELALESIEHSDGSSTDILNDVKSMLDRVMKGIRRADRIVQGIIDNSVMQIGEELVINISEGDARTVILEALSERSEADQELIHTDIQSVPGYWDLNALQRSVEALISNAFKHGEEGKVVKVRCESTHGRLLISVHNYGKPVSVESNGSLFQTFMKIESDSSRGTQAPWANLDLVRATVERMGGSLGLESSPENGTTFILDMPCDTRPFQNFFITTLGSGQTRE